jgi:hypothetical protein
MASAVEMITIPATHLAELEAEIASLKERLAKRMNNNITRLQDYIAANPDKKHEAKVKYRDTHRDEINARRRERRRQLKEESKSGGEVTAVIVPS